MNNISDELFDSLARYFKTLERLGYKSYREVYKLLVFVFVEELLEGPMSVMVTEADYRTISDALYTVYGSCLIPWPTYKRAVDEEAPSLPGEFRVTERGRLRDGLVPAALENVPFSDTVMEEAKSKEEEAEDTL